MLKVVFPIMFVLSSCNTNHKITEPFPSSSPLNDNGWVVYEGRVPIEDKKFLYMELSMRPGTINGEGYFNLAETLESENDQLSLSALSGTYLTSYGQGTNQDSFFIQFNNSARPSGVKRIYKTSIGPKKIREEYFRKNDLVLKSSGGQMMLVLDNGSEPITTEPVYNLAKRTSRLFTLEGYLTHRGDTADFLEMNTGEKFTVSKRGAYDEAIKQYHRLRIEKYEGIYLKAVGYTINHTNEKGNTMDALVLKRLLQMTSSGNP